MLQFDLRADDHDLLVDIMTAYLGDLRVEIGDTSSYEYRTNLKAEEQAVRRIIDTLTRPTSATNPGAPSIF